MTKIHKSHFFCGGLVFLILVAAFFIRFFGLLDSPPAPYWEEVALGYDAYALAETGSDHHGNPWPKLAVESFGDWKPSGYFYALIPFIKIFGLNLMSVRLPSLLAGVSIVAGLGVLTWQLTAKAVKPTTRKWLSLLAMFLATLSPWLIQFSRAAWEANLATNFILWGVIFGWQAGMIRQKDNKRFIWFGLSMISLFIAFYTYHSARILAPILGIWLGWTFIYQDWRVKLGKVSLIGYFVLVMIALFFLQPLIAAWGTPVLQQRLAETSIMNDVAIIEESNRLRALHDNSLLGRVIYHRYVILAGVILQHFFAHFSFDFLFVSGDANPRHTSQYFGLFYPFEFLFLLVGVWWGGKNLSNRQKGLLLVWLIFGILPASLTKTIPHALRILLTAPVWILVITLGVWQVIDWCQRFLTQLSPIFKNSRLFLFALLLFSYLGFFVVFYRHLLTVYPQRYSSEWQYGYQQLVQTLETLGQKYPDWPIYITREQGRPAMYYWFYTRTDPRLVQEANASAKKDQGEFLEFANIRFVNGVGEILEQPSIVAASASEIANLPSTVTFIEEVQVDNFAQTPVWKIGIVKPAQ